MNYRLVWLPKADEVLATHYFLAFEKGSDPTFLDFAVSEINAMLAANPVDAGESRNGKRRIAFVRHLSVIFEAVEAEGVILIYDAQVRLPS